jgi:hypothetical protein
VWLRRAPARGVAEGILTSRDALYPEFIDRDSVVGEWKRLLGGAENAPIVSRYLTLEIWLQQAFNGRWRTAPARLVTT